MEFKDYETIVDKTELNCSVNGDTLAYSLIGLTGEVGEVAEKLKRIYRGDLSLEENKEELLKELGDVLWYLTRFAKSLGYNLEDVAKANINKLEKRLKNGTLRGSGDNR